MMGSKKLLIALVVLLVGLFCLSGSLWAARDAQQAELEDKARLLRGDVWMKMTQNEKVAYIWGAGNVVDLEQELMAIFPELKVANFSAKATEGMADVTINEIIARVDSFYKANPDKLDHSVIVVIWSTMIKPNLKTSIAGRPIK